MTLSIQQLELKSVELRVAVLQMIYAASGGHTGGSLSSVDIINVLYNRIMNVSPENFTDPNRDRYIQSKGHSVESLFAMLADCGFFPKDVLNTVSKYQSDLAGHPTRHVPGIEHNTGALGHGLSVAVGHALAGKMDERSYRVFTLLGDGELTEGSNWEAAMSAAHYRLDNLVAIVDRNGLQITGRTEDVMALEPLADKFRAFGFAVRECDGNSIPELVDVLEHLPFEPGKPSALIAKTVKGKGVSFIENQKQWHHKVPTADQLGQALKELEARADQLKATA